MEMQSGYTHMKDEEKKISQDVSVTFRVVPKKCESQQNLLVLLGIYVPRTKRI